MKAIKKLAPHLLLLMAASAVAYVLSDPAQDKTKAMAPGEVQLWKGRAEQVSVVRYESAKKIVTLTQKKDAEGAYFLGAVDPVEKPSEKSATEGAGGGESDKKAKPPQARPKPVEPQRFVSVRNGAKIIEQLASLRAKRMVGQVEEARSAEFGLDQPDGTLSVTVAGTTHQLVVGKPTPGSGNRYVRQLKTGRVFVIDAAFVRDLGGGAARLREGTMHAWKTTDPVGVTIKSGDTSRSVIRSGTEGRRFWASPEDKDKNDETVANWLSKLDRLRPLGYVEALPEGAVSTLRVDYRGEKKSLGFIELFKQAADPSDTKAKDGYFAKTEQTRYFVTVTLSLAEQIKDDVRSVLGLQPEPDGGPAASATGSVKVAPPAAPHGSPHSPHGSPGTPRSSHSPH